MERACPDRRCRPFVPYLPYNPCHPVVRCCPFVPYLPYNPCHPVVRCRLCAPGYQLGLYPPFVPAFPVVPVVRAALARHPVRTVQAVPALRRDRKSTRLNSSHLG